MDLTNEFEKVKAASKKLGLISAQKTNEVLNQLAEAVVKESATILAANQKDLDQKDVNDPMYDRLKLTEDRLKGIADGIKEVAQLPCPMGRVLSDKVRPNGLHIRKISVPFGVIGIIYEARPNVGLDVFSLCFKSGNACLLKGGTDAHESNSAIVKVIQQVLHNAGIDENTVLLMPAGRESTGEILKARGYVDLVIPRGSAGLIRYVNENAKVPVIETGAGTCHTYIEAEADLKKATAIVLNGKTRRVSVCNALDCTLIDSSRLQDLPALCEPLAEKNVEIHADERAYKALQGKYKGTLKPATEEDWGKEFLSYTMALKTVDGLDEAIAYIGQYGNGHSEAIVSENKEKCLKFQTLVDASSVYANAPTSFTDGNQFGLGAEIGISTQKMHARGPMGLEELNTYKWFIDGNGQTRA